jgi:hypothetical protein
MVALEMRSYTFKINYLKYNWISTDKHWFLENEFAGNANLSLPFCIKTATLKRKPIAWLFPIQAFH